MRYKLRYLELKEKQFNSIGTLLRFMNTKAYSSISVVRGKNVLQIIRDKFNDHLVINTEGEDSNESR